MHCTHAHTIDTLDGKRLCGECRHYVGRITPRVDRFAGFGVPSKLPQFTTKEMKDVLKTGHSWQSRRIEQLSKLAKESPLKTT